MLKKQTDALIAAFRVVLRDLLGTALLQTHTHREAGVPLAMFSMLHLVISFTYFTCELTAAATLRQHDPACFILLSIVIVSSCAENKINSRADSM